MANPFHYGTPATGDYFTGRGMELDALLSRARDGLGVALISPRRYGKTSLLIKADEILTSEKRMVVRLNAFGCLNAETFASRLAGATYATRAGRWHKLKNALPEFVKHFRVTPSIELAGDSPSFRFTPGMTSPQLEDVITDVYRTLAEGSTSKSPAVLIIDEFQELPTLGEHLPGLFKSLMDQHPGVSLVIAGSKQHLIERLVLERNAPLFGMLATVTLGEIPRAEMSAFLRRRATRGRKRMSEEVAEAIVAMVGPAPNDIQHLAYEAFNAAAGAVITQQHVRRGLDLAAQHGSTVFQSRFDSCSDGQKRVLLELAQRPTKSVFGADFRDAVRLKSSGSVRNAVAALVEQDLVAQRDGVHFVADPFMAEWLCSIAQS